MDYTLSHIAATSGGTLHGSDRHVTAVATDSRNHIARPADTLFVALTGPNHDGHHYIADLYRRGVRSFLAGYVPDTAASAMPEASFVTVPDTLQALQALAAYHRQQYNGTVAAVTGSNGKTVVKEWIAQLWPEGAGRLLRSPRSYNSQIGVALSLLMIRGDEQLVVIEAGISQPGEMERLEAMIRPQIGILTNIGAAHSENFNSDEQKLDEKLKLFRGAEAVIYHADSPLIARHIGKRYGKCPERLHGWRADEMTGLAELFGDYASRENAAHVAALYRLLGIAPKPFSELQPVAMRLELREGILGSTLINDSYNSDLTSLGIALDCLDHNAGERSKALILSDIMQAGLKPDELYRQVAALVREHGVADLIGIGPEVTSAAHRFAAVLGPEHAHFYASTDDFLRHADKERFAGRYILIKGSRAFGFERISRFLEKRTHTTTLEVNLTALADNLNHFRAMLRPETRVMVMVKAYSYGTGADEIAAMLQHEGVDYLAVAFADEGVALREAGIHLPIVVLNSDPGSFAVMADYDLEPEIYSFASLKNYACEMGSRGIAGAPIHLKMDTGMHRLGFMPDDIPALCDALKRENAVRVRSIFSHLAASEDPAEDEFTRGQIAAFTAMSGRIVEALGDTSILRHICNSAGIVRFPEAHFDMVRLGVGLYGIEDPKLQVAATLKTQIVQIKHLHAGDTVGYNRRGVVGGPMRMATIPIGYADGMDRGLGNGAGQVCVRGVLCPTIGNICMDTCMIDVTAVPEAAEGDEVVIFGEKPTVRDVARVLGTISYEVLTSVSARIKRIYVRE
ncbi:alanine racemase [uncultured Rikenella sp.]|uniref:alanine racemase n=1 Tax=uncultured Rikenella sp. TaxID=368003 RepID=UPI00260A4225|nr:alanine racemase [uncultured Rikenella sp.]